MNVRAWSVSLLLFLSTVTAVGQTVNRYLNTPLPKEWEESGEVFQQTLPVDDHWWKSFQDTRLDSLIALAVDRNYSVAGSGKIPVYSIEREYEKGAAW